MLKSWDQDKDLSIPVDRYISPTNVENCDIIASNAHTASIPKLLETLAENSDGVSMYEVLIYRLYQIEAIYDYIIIDTRPSKDERLVKSSHYCQRFSNYPLHLQRPCHSRYGYNRYPLQRA